MLASLSRSSNTDNLARTTLQDYNITNANEVARDGDSIRNATTAGIVVAVRSAVVHLSAWSANTNFGVFDSDVLLYNTIFVVVVMVMMVVTAAVDRVQDAVGGAVETLTERVVLAVVVVIAHVTQFNLTSHVSR